MIRALALACVLFVASGCADATDATDVTAETGGDVEPWKMWGNTQIIELVKDVVGSPDIQTAQLVRIAYGRPETWKFFFHMKVLESSNPGGAGVTQVRYNLTTGIGRSQSTIDDFELFMIGTLPFVGNEIYSSTVNGGLRTPTDTAPNIISEIVAQDVQLNARVLLTGPAAPGTRVTVAVSAYFAPATHIRPEWFEAVGVFNGEENRGQ